MSDFNQIKISNWNENIESVLSELGKTCSSYKWMNIETAKRNEFKYNLLMYSTIIIGPVSGILSVFSQDSSVITNMFITVFSFMNGVVSAIIKFSEFGEKASLYKGIAAKYSSLENNIKRQLSLDKTERVNAGEYLEWISRSYDELFSSTPLIPSDIYERFIVKEETKKETIEPIKLGNSYSIDFSRYSDGKMKYELARLAKT